MKRIFFLLAVCFFSAHAMNDNRNDIAMRRAIMQIGYGEAVGDTRRSTLRCAAWMTGCGASFLTLCASVKRPFHLGRQIWTGTLTATFVGTAVRTYQSYAAKGLLAERAEQYRMAMKDDRLAQKLLQEIGSNE